MFESVMLYRISVVSRADLVWLPRESHKRNKARKEREREKKKMSDTKRQNKNVTATDISHRNDNIGGATGA